MRIVQKVSGLLSAAYRGVAALDTGLNLKNAGNLQYNDLTSESHEVSVGISPAATAHNTSTTEKYRRQIFVRKDSVNIIWDVIR